MRYLLLLGILAACGPSSGECEIDGCGGNDVCTRNGECLPPSQVRSVRVSWTIRGQPASETTCAATPNFYLLFSAFDPGDTYGYEPVPCKAGLFTVDKIPVRFTSVEIGVEGRFRDEAVFDSMGRATFDLMP